MVNKSEKNDDNSTIVKEKSVDELLLTAEQSLKVKESNTIVFEEPCNITMIVDSYDGKELKGRMFKLKKPIPAFIPVAQKSLKTQLDNLRVSESDIINIKYIGKKLNQDQSFEFKSFIVKRFNKDGTWSTTKSVQ